MRDRSSNTQWRTLIILLVELRVIHPVTGAQYLCNIGAKKDFLDTAIELSNLIEK